MASTAAPQIRKIRTPKPQSAPELREQEILKEFEAFFDRHISSMSPNQLEQFERQSAEILKESRSRASEAVSTHEKEQPSPKARRR
jgi:hypothetical protein